MSDDNGRKWNPALKSPKSRTPVKLAEGLEKRLLAYTIAAGAGLMVSSQPATAGIVVKDVNTPIPFVLDVDGDGTDDFDINVFFSGTATLILSMNAEAASNAIVATSTAPFAYASKLATTNSVTASQTFGSIARLAKVTSGGTTFGNFANVTNAFVGLRFKISGITHFGFARFDVSTSPGTPPTITGTLTGFGYETKAGVSAHVEPVPEPGTLGLLALGAVGLAAWRRRKAQKEKA